MMIQRFLHSYCFIGYFEVVKPEDVNKMLEETRPINCALDLGLSWLIKAAREGMSHNHCECREGTREGVLKGNSESSTVRKYLLTRKI